MRIRQCHDCSTIWRETQEPEASCPACSGAAENASCGSDGCGRLAYALVENAALVFCWTCYGTFQIGQTRPQAKAVTIDDGRYLAGIVEACTRLQKATGEELALAEPYLLAAHDRMWDAVSAAEDKPESKESEQ